MNAPAGKNDNEGRSREQRDSVNANTNVPQPVRSDNGWNAGQPGAHKAHDVAPDAAAPQAATPTKINRYQGPGAREGTSTTAGPGDRLPQVNPLGPDMGIVANPGAVVDLRRNGFVGPGANPGRDPMSIG